MKAMILAAGLGTRLRPLTNDRPKALVEINGRTLLEITVARLAAFGVTEIIINVHHFADMVVAYLKSKNNFGLRVEVSREDDLLLDTGGGLRKAAWFFLDDATRPSPCDEPFLLHNVDVISNIDLHPMLQFHQENNAMATLAVQSRPSSRQLLFNHNLQLSGRRIQGHDTLITAVSEAVPQTFRPEAVTLPAATPPSDSPLPSRWPAVAGHTPLLLPLAFSGIHMLSPRLLPVLTESTPVFSVIDAYLRLASQGHKILAFRADSYYWRDLGRPSDLAQAALDLRQKGIAL